MVAHWALDSMRPAVMVNAPRIRPPGSAVIGPKSGLGEDPAAALGGVKEGLLTLKGSPASEVASALTDGVVWTAG